MTHHRLLAAGIAFMAVALSGRSQAAIDAPLGRVLTAFATKAGPDQAKQVADAITASPPLEARLDRLAAAGTLKAIELAPQEDDRLDEGRGAEVVDGHILLTSKFLLGQPPHRRVDAKPGDLDPPDNLVFVLGHLTYHLDQPLDRKSLPADADAKVNIGVRDEAKAYIQGWNDLIDAVAKLKGRPITAAEAASLLPNFKYRSYFIKANGKQMIMAPDGHVTLDGRNLNAMTSALFESEVPDFQ